MGAARTESSRATRSWLEYVRPRPEATGQALQEGKEANAAALKALVRAAVSRNQSGE